MQQSLFAAPSVAEEPSAKMDWASAHLEDAIFTVIDLETTGLNAKKNAITEITAITFKNGQELDKFSTLVKPTEPIPEIATNITGITDEMVQNAPALVMVLSDLCQFAGEQPIIVGHNVPFDIGFTREKLSESGLDALTSRFELGRAFCTKQLAQKALPGLPSYEGIVVATQCGVSNDNPHRAEYDVRMSAGILFEIIDRVKLEDSQIKTVQDLLNYQGELKP